MDPATEEKIYSILVSDPHMILLFKNKFITNNMWKIAIEGEPSLFQYMKDPPEDIVLFALSEDGANIQYLEGMGITITNKMIFTALKNYPGAIHLIPKELRTAHIREYACKLDPSLMREIPVHRNFVNQQLKNDPMLVRFLSSPTEDQLCTAIRSNPNACAYISEFTPRVVALVRELYPELIPLIPALSRASDKDRRN